MVMQGESVSGRLATWVAGVLGVWAGLAALGSLIAALMVPEWAHMREPIVIAENPTRSRDFSEAGLRDSSQAVAILKPVVTTVTFRLGMWKACPSINISHLHMLAKPPLCSGVNYAMEQISHQNLDLPAPAPLVQTVLTRMRLSAPFLMLSCGLLAVGTILALVGRCCYTHASLVAALMFSLGGLSVGVGVVWFVSVVSEEYSVASGRRTSWANMYAYRYGWSLMAAGGGGVAALLAAFLTGHSHLARHAPLVSIIRTRSSSTEEGLARPLLRCRSEGCMGQRSFTSDTIRTYLTCDSRRHPSRGCPPLPLPQSPSIVDLTKPNDELIRQTEDLTRSNEDPVAENAISRRSSKATILGEDGRELVQHYQQIQHHYHQPQQHHFHQQPQNKQHPQLQRGWSSETSRVIIEAPRGAVAQVVPPPPVSEVLSPVTPVPPPPPLSSSSSSPSPLEPPPPPLPPTTKGSNSRRPHEENRSAYEPFRLPEYNSFTVGDYSRTLPTEGRQMAVFGRRSTNRAATLSRSSTKISSEV